MQRLPRDSNELDQAAAELAKNHNLSGVCLHFFWNDLEKVSGKPDFSMVDKTVAEFRRLGMKYELGFGAGTHTPRLFMMKAPKLSRPKCPIRAGRTMARRSRFPFHGTRFTNANSRA